jgi:hypothetical protein
MEVRNPVHAAGLPNRSSQLIPRLIAHAPHNRPRDDDFAEAAEVNDRSDDCEKAEED